MTFRRRIIEVLPEQWQETIRSLISIEEYKDNLGQLALRVLMENYKSVASSELKSTLKSHEAKVNSQHGEDGILLHIFSRIGATNHEFVEFGIENGRECNTANLSINFGWRGLLMDVNPQNISKARAFYNEVLAKPSNVEIAESHVTAENINETLLAKNCDSDLDLLSIDIDGNDYWVWKAIADVRPRVVVIEYNATLGRDEAITVRYDPDFNRWSKHKSGFYYGASLPAMVKLAESKGYALLGCDSSGVNAFFGRRDVVAGKIEELTIQEAFVPDTPFSWSRRKSQVERFNLIKSVGFEYV